MSDRIQINWGAWSPKVGEWLVLCTHLAAQSEVSTELTPGRYGELPQIETWNFPSGLKVPVRWVFVCDRCGQNGTAVELKPRQLTTVGTRKIKLEGLNG